MSDFDTPSHPCPLKVGDVVEIPGMICGNYDVGGTVIFEHEEAWQAEVTKAWWDYETGWRFHGRLTDPALVEAVRSQAVTGRTADEYREKYPSAPDLILSTEKALIEFDPTKVYFDEFSLLEPRHAAILR